MRAIFFIFSMAVLLLLSSNASSQTVLMTSSNDSIPAKLRKKWPSSRQADSLAAVRALNRWLANMYDQGYLEAEVSELNGNSDTLQARLSIGKQYRWVKLENANIDEGWLSEAGFRDRLYREKPVSPSGMAGLNRKMLTWCENNGFPFASIRYDNIEFISGGVSANLVLDTERKITIDSVIIRGEPKLAAVYLYSYLGIKPGDLYNESVIRKISVRLKELPMIAETRPFSVAFSEETARVILTLEDKKASQIDGIIGVLPDNEKSGKVQVTGDLRLRLLSSFGRGELFDLNWKQPKKQTQDLKVNLNYPFLFNTPFGIDLKFGLYKLDTSYIETTLGAGIQFLLKQGSFLKVFVDDKNSNLLSTKQYENLSVLPPFADVRRTMYGIGLKALNLDYRLNPSRGFMLEFSAAAGNRKISKNGKLRPEVYDSLELKSLQVSGELAADFYLPLYSKIVMNPGVRFGGLGGDESFENELYRIGGLSTLRGFDEESITASVYTIAKMEFRYLLDQNSFLQLFFNGAWYERNTRSGFLTDTPIGFGAGITFQTRLGIFSFNYALGREFNDPVRFRAAKIHFGLVNYF